MEDPMVLGMSLETYTQLHVLISFLGIGSGAAVMYGFFRGHRLNGLTVFFLVTTVLTSVTGFGFPFTQLLPSHILGILSLIALAIAIGARYGGKMQGASRWIYVVTASISLYFNVFVLVAQSFEKVPGLHALAPTQKEPPFAIAQGVVLVLFIALTVMAVKRFHPEGAVSGISNPPIARPKRVA
jgi:hypothetical protein